MVRIAVTKGRIEEEVCKMLKDAGFDTRKITDKDRALLIKMTDGVELIFTKSNDILTFIEKGIVDLGIVGKDILEESEFREYNELLDLNVGKCYFALAGFPEYKNKGKEEKKRIATRYPNIAKKYFFDRQEDVEIIRMEGSVELGPICGISDAIVDLVQTGDTLKANGLEVIEKIEDISTRLIANKESVKEKAGEIYSIVDRLEGAKC